MDKLTIYSPDNMDSSVPVMIIILLAAITIILSILLLQRNRSLIRLQQSEKMRSSFLRNLVHEFRSPLTIIHREIRNQEFSPKMLADELALSLSQLNRRLNSVAGKPSSTYILQVKMAHARKILASQQKAIGEVAAECGIYDVNYFSRIFKSIQVLHLLNTSDFPASMKDELKNIGEGTHFLLNFFCFQQQSCIFVKIFSLLPSHIRKWNSSVYKNETIKPGVKSHKKKEL